MFAQGARASWEHRLSKSWARKNGSLISKRYTSKTEPEISTTNTTHAPRASFSPRSLPFFLLVILPRLDAQHAITHATPPPAPDLLDPLRQCEAPMAGNQSTANHVDDPDQEQDNAVARLDDVEQDGLDVVFEKYAGDHPLVDLLALLRYCVLVGEDGVRAPLERFAHAIDGWDDGHVVLELVEVCRRGVDCLIKRVDQRGQVGAE